MDAFAKQAEEKLGAPIVGGASFVTPGFDFAGDTRVHAIVDRIVNLFREESGEPVVRDEDTLNGFVGAVYVAATQTELAIFSIESTLWTSTVGQLLMRCERNDKTSLAYVRNKKTEVKISTSDDQCFTLTTQDIPENVARLARVFDDSSQKLA